MGRNNDNNGNNNGNGNNNRSWTPRSPLDEFVSAQEKVDKVQKFMRRCAKGRKSGSDSDSESERLAKKLVKASMKMQVLGGLNSMSSSSPSPAAQKANSLMDRLLGLTGSGATSSSEMQDLISTQKKLLTEFEKLKEETTATRTAMDAMQTPRTT